MVSIGIMCTLLTAPLESSSSDDDVVMSAAKDPEYVCPPESESDSTDDSDEDASHYREGEDGHSKISPMSKDGDHSKERYFLVAESSLCGLMSRCKHCGGRTTIVMQQAIGSMVVVSAKCSEGHTLSWESQPRHNSPQHKHWPTGPAHFSDRRASTGQYIVSFTGPAGPPS